MPLDQHEDPFEDRLGDALRRAGDAFETDGHAMVSGGAVRGRRLLYRRRAAMVGGVAGIALIGVGGAVLLPVGGGENGKQSVAAGRSTGPAPRNDDGTVSGADLVRKLKGLLPEGKFSGEAARGTDASGGPYAQVVYDDGEGGAAVQLGLGRIEADSELARQLTDCPDKTFVEFDSCEESTLPDGSRLMLFQGYEYPDRRVDTKHWYAQLVTPDGYDVSVMEWNAEAQKDAPVTRDEPPLSTAQLKEIATDPGWRKAIDTIPEETEKEKESQEEKERSSTEKPDPGSSDSVGSGSSAGSTSVDPPMVDSDTIQKTLAGLLPDGVDVVGKGGQESEFAYVVLDDGKGQSLVQINVQPGMADVADSLFGADAETLPDGTKVVTQQEPGEKGGEGVVMWTVDTLRTDGLRVVISAFNSGAQHTAATRDTPALTMAQLKEIATSEKWKTLG
ncbi:hypothetical protein [Streptomyces sp. DSM 40750]|uniref:hypothetical protein n=1 Tax=Streptomyces sp. DSM 40750 TaxID=2801030 RepID=UPI00214BABF2|nr:hypothetical protein [Streptomyces sp. DSM 40750]UUU24658.1 hypothetical protein JIX55_32840 [Streptomyces sp. DSM 40750]